MTYEEVNLVITDDLLSDISGVDVVKVIREKSEVPVVMMSGLIEETKTEYNSVHFVEKPFSIKVMETAVSDQSEVTAS